MKLWHTENQNSHTLKLNPQTDLKAGDILSRRHTDFSHFLLFSVTVEALFLSRHQPITTGKISTE